MIHSIEFTENWRCFKAGDSFDFRPGVNLLVGDQGCGKSSLLNALIDKGKQKRRCKDLVQTKVCCDAGKFYTFDFEKENPRTQGRIGKNALFQAAAMFSSHGECNTILINALKEANGCTVMMDEPDMALSIRTCKLLVKRFKGLVDRGSQVIAAVHNMAVIQSFDEVLSLEHGKWMPSSEFIASHLACEHCDCHPCGCGG